jgi:hypothetical protein
MMQRLIRSPPTEAAWLKHQALVVVKPALDEAQPIDRPFQNGQKKKSAAPIRYVVKYEFDGSPCYGAIQINDGDRLHLETGHRSRVATLNPESDIHSLTMILLMELGATARKLENHPSANGSHVGMIGAVVIAALLVCPLSIVHGEDRPKMRSDCHVHSERPKTAISNKATQG